MIPTPIHLIAGLGNPGAQYVSTRHNAGQWFTERLAEQYQTQLHLEKSFKGFIAKISVESEKKIILHPNNYMNLSGDAVRAVSQFYKWPSAAILVAHDELDLPIGTAKFKQGGGHGGHNGLRHIIQQLGGADFWRLRIGIGRPPAHMDTADYVLQPPTRTEHDIIIASIESALSALPHLLNGDAQAAMRALH